MDHSPLYKPMPSICGNFNFHSTPRIIKRDEPNPNKKDDSFRIIINEIKIYDNNEYHAIDELTELKKELFNVSDIETGPLDESNNYEELRRDSNYCEKIEKNLLLDDDFMSHDQANKTSLNDTLIDFSQQDDVFVELSPEKSLNDSVLLYDTMAESPLNRRIDSINDSQMRDMDFCEDDKNFLYNSINYDFTH